MIVGETRTTSRLAGTTANSLGSTYGVGRELWRYYLRRFPGETLEMVLQEQADAILNADVSFYDYLKVHPEASLRPHIVFPVQYG